MAETDGNQKDRKRGKELKNGMKETDMAENEIEEMERAKNIWRKRNELQMDWRKQKGCIIVVSMYVLSTDVSSVM